MVAAGFRIMLSDPQVRGILAESGWSDIQLEPIDFAFVLGAGENPLDDALSYMLNVGPAARPARASASLMGSDRMIGL